MAGGDVGTAECDMSAALNVQHKSLLLQSELPKKLDKVLVRPTQHGTPSTHNDVADRKMWGCIVTVVYRGSVQFMGAYI